MASVQVLKSQEYGFSRFSQLESFDGVNRPLDSETEADKAARERYGPAEHAKSADYRALQTPTRPPYEKLLYALKDDRLSE